MRFAIKTEHAVLCAVLAATSCRQILGIEPGKAGSAVVGTGGASGTGSGGLDGGDGTGGATNGSGGQSGGAGGTSTGGSGTGGTGNPGGTTSAGGTTDQSTGGAGGAQGGAGGTTSAGLLPDPACAACFARNCFTEKDACQSDPNCVTGVPTWLTGCAEPDSGTCVVSDPGTLQTFETCGATSCDFCQHLADGKPSIEILSPSNGAVISVGAGTLVEVTVKVRNFNVQNLGLCGATDTDCGHIHINIDGLNCSVTTFFNTWTAAVDADNVADTDANVASCKVPIFGKPVQLRVSLSSNTSHFDRIPAVESSVTITVNQ